MTKKATKPLRLLILFVTHHRSALSILLLTSINIAIVIRFWMGVSAPRDQYIMDWSPAIYGIIGLFLSAMVLQFTLTAYKHLDKLPRNSNLLLLIVNIFCFANYMGVIGFLLYRGLTSETS